MRILVTGATGYIGGRVVEELLDLGHNVRVLVRDRERALARPWSERVEIAEGDLMRAESLREPLEGMDVAYYLVHSMYAGADFKTLDRRAAENFVEAAGHLSQVIYLGGILPQASTRRSPSGHLMSRAEVGEILRGSGSID